MPVMWGYFTGNVTSLGLCAADCTGCFQKETRDLLELPLRRAWAELSQEAAQASTSRPTGSPADEEKIFARMC